MRDSRLRRGSLQTLAPQKVKFTTVQKVVSFLRSQPATIRTKLLPFALLWLVDNGYGEVLYWSFRQAVYGEIERTFTLAQAAELLYQIRLSSVH